MYLQCISMYTLSHIVLFYRYEKYKNQNDETCYGVVGLSTVYEYYAYPENIRPRISQLLILPLFQNCGLAARLLLSIYNFYGRNQNVVDITGRKCDITILIIKM